MNKVAPMSFVNSYFPTQVASLPHPSSPSAFPPTPSSSSAMSPSPTNSSSTATRHVQPPRPPNAWILFRSEMSKQIASRPGSANPRPQAEISKTISEMWAKVDPETRAYYERLAETKKAEHAAKYPDYRFTPMKKEEKERIREEKRLEKERAQASRRPRTRATAAPYIVPHIPGVAGMPIYPPAPSFGHYGPSPPISAAPSPNDPPFFVPEADQSKPSIPLSATPAPSLDVKPTALPPSTANELIAPVPQHHIPSFYMETLSTSTTPAPTQWSDPATSQTLTPVGSQDTFTFNVPHVSSQSNDTMGNLSIPEFDSTMQALLSATGNPSIFSMADFDPQSLLTHPTGEIEVNFQGFQFDESFLSGIDFTEFLNSMNAEQPSYELPATYADQYINYDGVSEAPAPAPTAPSSPPQPPRSAPPAPGGYVPPAGAAQSGNRRVAGTWTRDFAPTDGNSSRSTSVSAT